MSWSIGTRRTCRNRASAYDSTPELAFVSQFSFAVLDLPVNSAGRDRPFVFVIPNEEGQKAGNAVTVIRLFLKMLAVTLLPVR
jgi:hypothetical protein